MEVGSPARLSRSVGMEKTPTMRQRTEKRVRNEVFILAAGEG